jgi:hypothetical protein
LISLKKMWSDGTFTKLFKPADLIAKVIARAKWIGARRLAEGWFGQGVGGHAGKVGLVVAWVELLAAHRAREVDSMATSSANSGRGSWGVWRSTPRGVKC